MVKSDGGGGGGSNAILTISTKLVEGSIETLGVRGTRGGGVKRQTPGKSSTEYFNEDNETIYIQLD